MSSSTDLHTPIPSKRSTTDRFALSSETEKSSPGNFDEIDALIAENIDEAILSCPVLLVEHFSSVYPNINVDKLFDTHREVRLAITGDDALIIKDMPTIPHEIVNRFFENKIARINMSITNDEDIPVMSLGSATIRYVESSKRYETDSSYRNMHAPIHLNQQGQPIPSIIIEVGYSESIASLFETASAYLENPHVHLVISVKIVGKNEKADELICFVHRRNAEGISIDSAISFGRPLSNSTRASIMRELGVSGTLLLEVPEAGYPYTRQNLHWITIPSDILWKEAEAMRPEGSQDYQIFLYDILKVLKFSGNGNLADDIVLS